MPVTLLRNEIQLDEPSTPPSTIQFLHPAYADKDNILLTLPALDDGGIHYGTALTFCGILAGNSFTSGFFAASREADPERSDWDSVLTGSVYYFFAGSDRTDKYPIYTSFQDWPFPAQLPLEWQTYTTPTASSERPVFGLQAGVKARDISCRLTSSKIACEVAHIVPISEVHWFEENRMATYIDVADDQAIDKPANAILLRKDMHHTLDKKLWTPMLKEGCLVLCSICAPPAQCLAQFRHQYQNTPLKRLENVSKECMFARIAWAVIPRTKAFLQRRTAIPQETTSIFSGKGVVCSLDSSDLKKLIGSQSRSRTRSSTQRTGSATETPPPLSDDDGSCETVSPPRGRKRQRRSPD